MARGLQFPEFMMRKKKISMTLSHLKTRFVLSRGKALMSHPLFWFLTVAGNGAILAGAYVFFRLENGINPRLHSFLDALWWSVATVTTVGYGDVTPISTLGRISGMLLMIIGTALFGSFTALFAAVLLQPEISEVEGEVRELEKTVNRIER